MQQDHAEVSPNLAPLVLGSSGRISLNKFLDLNCTRAYAGCTGRVCSYSDCDRPPSFPFAGCGGSP